MVAIGFEKRDPGLGIKFPELENFHSRYFPDDNFVTSRHYSVKDII